MTDIQVATNLAKVKAELQNSLNEMEAIRRFIHGQPLGVSTFIDEKTLTYGYGQLHGTGTWEFELPQWFVDKIILKRG